MKLLVQWELINKCKKRLIVHKKSKLKCLKKVTTRYKLLRQIFLRDKSTKRKHPYHHQVNRLNAVLYGLFCLRETTNFKRFNNSIMMMTRILCMNTNISLIFLMPYSHPGQEVLGAFLHFLNRIFLIFKFSQQKKQKYSRMRTNKSLFRSQINKNHRNSLARQTFLKQ